MRIILCAMVLSLVSVADAAPLRGPTSVLDNDLRYVCKSSTASNVTYVANVTDGIIKVYATPEEELATGLRLELADLRGLEVVKNVTDISTKKGKKFQTSYTFLKAGENGGSKRPILEIEMERDSNAKFVAYADAKLMGVKPSDTDDVDENITCKRNIKF